MVAEVQMHALVEMQKHSSLHPTTLLSKKQRRRCVLLLAAVCGIFAAASREGLTWSTPAGHASNSAPSHASHDGVSFGKRAVQAEHLVPFPKQVEDWTSSLQTLVRVLGCLGLVAAVSLTPAAPSNVAHASLLAEYKEGSLSYDKIKEPKTAGVQAAEEKKAAAEKKKAEAKKKNEEKKAADEKKKAEAKKAAEEKKAAAEKKKAEAKAAIEAKKAAAAQKAAEDKTPKTETPKPAASVPESSKAPQGKSVPTPKPVPTIPKSAPAGVAIAVGSDIAKVNKENAQAAYIAATKAKSDAVEQAQAAAADVTRIEANLKAADEAYKQAPLKEQASRLKTLQDLREKKKSAEKEAKNAEGNIQKNTEGSERCKETSGDR